jgi:hypothetical protein
MFIYFVIFVVINELLTLNTINICQEETEPDQWDRVPLPEEEQVFAQDMILTVS